MDQEVIKKRAEQVLYDKKWIIFLSRTWLFRHLPFVDFALAAGSMALGNVNPNSDFDVIIGVRRGRIFTTRAFAIMAFGIFGWRRKKMDHHETASDKICLNHFVTEKSYKLSPPHSSYWRALYKNLVPVYGDRRRIEEFFSANADWIGEKVDCAEDLRRFGRGASAFEKSIEFFLGGRFGDWVERILRTVQIRRIESGLAKNPPGYKPRIAYGDDELEFHPDTRRIELLDRVV